MKPEDEVKSKAKASEKEEPGPAGERRIPEEEYRALLKKAEELDSLRDKMLRTAAEYENSKKRFNREKEEFLKFANERLIREFLPVLDHLDRALVHAKNHKDSREAILEGIEIIRKHLCEIFKSHGIERLETIGKKFDPHFHEVLGEVEDPKAPEETILEEIEGGYLLQGRLLRPAKVRIAKALKTGGKKDEEKDADIT